MEKTIIWITGLSGSGKTTIAQRLKKELTKISIPSVNIDGDELRAGLCSDLKFSIDDRKENIRRAGEIAIIIAKNNIIPICSLISPIRTERTKIRRRCEEDGIRFQEIYLSTPLEICRERDPKGLYKKVGEGSISNFTGVDSIYERPDNPEVTIDTSSIHIDDCVKQILNLYLTTTKS
jgi:adenylyl-sulfate kinase